MRIDEELCTGCWECVPYCPVGAIVPEDGIVRVNEDLCVECGTCLHSAPCPSQAFYEPDSVSQWPRSLRKAFSYPKSVHPTTGLFGRGTEECKTNDVTGRVKRGRIGVALEMGRPGVGSDFYEVERVTTALAALGVSFEPHNPVTHLIADTASGRIIDEVKGERVLSAIVEIEAGIEMLKPILETVRRIAGEIRTVFSLDLICRFDPDGSIPVLPVLEGTGMAARPNAKVNIGAGRPLAEL